MLTTLLVVRVLMIFADAAIIAIQDMVEGVGLGNQYLIVYLEDSANVWEV